MLSLNNAQLNVAVLDPVADQERFGARYCTGGYILQVTDQRIGDLIGGPSYPFSFNWFDGAGLPESFRTHLADPNDANNTIELGIGIGRIDRSNNKVLEFCLWEVTEERDALHFKTAQSYLAWSFELVHTLRLTHRTLTSELRLKSTGQAAVPVYWFPHPFFPHYPGGECCKLNVGVRLNDSPGYELLPSGFIGQKNLPWDRRGFFQELDFDKGQPVTLLQRHPKLGLIAATCSYAPAYFPIWGNKNTFSFEPYYQRDVAPGEEASWSITYDF
jgi:hypothetical protein